MAKKILGVLDCDELAPELRDEYRNYGRMFKSLLEPVTDHWEVRSYSILEGHWPEKASDCDAWLITGSKTGVYDSDAWLAPLKDFVLSIYEAQVPVVGICFGHQFLANTLGGCAEKSSKGWGIGIREVYADLTPEWMTPALPALKLLYSHQDQVTRLPPAANRLYGDDFCEFAAFQIAGRVLAFQGHPEFTKPYMSGLMELRQSRYAPGQYELGLSSLKQEHDGNIVAQWIFQFLDAALAAEIRGE